MANKKAAIKSLRQNITRHERNKSTMSEVRTIAKKIQVLITEKKREEADTMLRLLESKLDRAAKKDVIKKTTASRRIARVRAQWDKTCAG
ncbi:MAG: 30S ribosomal protein S20 [Candidatus Omnitrophota bacterium]